MADAARPSPAVAKSFLEGYPTGRDRPVIKIVRQIKQLERTARRGRVGFRSRRRLQTTDPWHGAYECSEAAEGDDGLFAARGDAAEAFDLVEDPLEEGAFPSIRSMALAPLRVGFRLIRAAAPGSSTMKSRRGSASQPASATTWPTSRRPSISLRACGRSRPCPGVIRNRIGSPGASTAAWASSSGRPARVRWGALQAPLR